MEMRYSKSGLKLTEQFEGCKLIAYQDKRGIWTIGYGHTLNVTRGMTFTMLEAERWLLYDVGMAEWDVNQYVRVALTQDEFDALVDFVFNVGGRNFQQSTLLRKLNAGDYAGAAAEFDRWDHVAGKVCKGLLQRREKETAEFDAGQTSQS